MAARAFENSVLSVATLRSPCYPKDETSSVVPRPWRADRAATGLFFHCYRYSSSTEPHSDSTISSGDAPASYGICLDCTSGSPTSTTSTAVIERAGSGAIVAGISVEELTVVIVNNDVAAGSGSATSARLEQSGRMPRDDQPHAGLGR